MSTTRFFTLTLDEPRDPRDPRAIAPTEQFIEIERPNGDCCGCCGCFGRQERPRYGMNAMNVDWLSQQTGVSTTGVVGGIGFAMSVIGALLLVLCVWSLDSFGDVSASAIEVGSGV